MGVQSKRKELSAIQQELQSTRHEIEEYKKLEQSLGGELELLESRNQEARKKMELLQHHIRLAEIKKQGLKSKIGALGQASGFWRSELESDVRAYAGGLTSRNEAFGTAELWSEAYRRAAILEKTELMKGIEGISRKTQAAEEQTRRQAADLADSSRKAQAEQKTRQQEYQQKQAAMAEASRKKQEAMKHAHDLAETAQALTRLIKMLSQRIHGQQRKTAQSPVYSLDVPRNSLAWPAEGSVVQAFGRQRNTELGTWVIHQGIVLETAAGAPVLPVKPGRVIYSGPFHSYGKVLILDHGGGFFSVYGELGEMLKDKGSDVQGGEAIARAGASADGKGRVYLELRRGTEALDPVDWLQKK
jgi:septal ring factor EnvC (AmiA/AmiB activator)